MPQNVSIQLITTQSFNPKTINLSKADIQVIFLKNQHDAS